MIVEMLDPGRLLAGVMAAMSLLAQLPPPTSPGAPTKAATEPDQTQAPAKVSVEPEAADSQIGARLENILKATGWFEQPRVSVKEGVVFLSGVAETDEYKAWANNLVHNTQDVVAVVNKMQVRRPSAWNFKPAIDSLKDLWLRLIGGLPFVLFGGLVLVTTIIVARSTRKLAQRVLKRRIEIPILRDLAARAIGFIIFLFGLYLVLRISGTTQLALTLLGGTGLIGLLLGIAFRDITENFLASIFLSMQRPFLVGDLVEITGVLGYVDRLTVRTTVLLSLDGNFVQIPNSVVYKNTIQNFTNNPSRRDAFTFTIPIQTPIEPVQKALMEVLKSHPDVKQTPEPAVLVDHPVANGVVAKVYYWIDSAKSDVNNVRSSLIRLCMNALIEARLLPLPGPTEVVFPRGMSVTRLNTPDDEVKKTTERPRPTGADDRNGMTEAEQHAPQGSSLKAATKEARPVEIGPDLLASSNGAMSK